MGTILDENISLVKSINVTKSQRYVKNLIIFFPLEIIFLNE